jgi:hypothetical protein
MADFTPPADLPTTPRTPNVSHPNLDGAASPQTIAQSARNGVPLSGRDPAPAARGLAIGGVTATGSQLNVHVASGATGTARLFLYYVDPQDGNKSYTRVWNTSCDPATNPAPDYGLSACAASDGDTPPWAPDMMGGILGSSTADVVTGNQTLSVPLSAAAASRLAAGGASLLVSFVNGQDEAQAFDIPVQASSTDGDVSGTVPPTLSLTLGPAAAFGAFVPGVADDYFAGTTANVISTAGDATLSVADPSSTATGHLVNGSFSLAEALQAKASSPAGAGSDYAAVGGSSSPTALLTYGGPVSNDPVAIDFKQSIGANEPLRTGSYSKTLTFTLSTTTP